MKVPLLLSVLLGGEWLLHAIGRLALFCPFFWAPAWRGRASYTLGTISVSLKLARTGASPHQLVSSVVPTRSAIFTWDTTVLAPLQLDRDVLFLDAWIDEGRDAPRLIGELLAHKRRVFIYTDRFPVTLLQKILEGRLIQVVLPMPTLVLEVVS